MCVVESKLYAEPSIDRKEILRYAGAAEGLYEIELLLDECLEELKGKLSYRVCFCELPIRRTDDVLILGSLSIASKDLQKNLKDCERATVFAATVGLELDRLIARYARLSPSKALLFQAIGAERIEALCDSFNRDVTEEKKGKGLLTRPRFSPGYGDFPIEVQRDLFAMLDCTKRIGISLNESLLMTPSKSVTAIIGISNALH